MIQDTFVSPFYFLMIFLPILIFNLLYFSEKRYPQIVKKFMVSKIKDGLALSYYLLSFIAFVFVSAI